MARFRKLGEERLSSLGDEELVAYVAAARDAGDLESARLAISILAFGLWDSIAYRVRLKIPADRVEEVTATVIENACHSAFDGRSIGEFRTWLKVIAKHRIADFHRKGSSKLRTEPLSGGEGGDEEIRLREPAADDDGIGTAEIRNAAGRVLEQRNEVHQMVIRLYGPNALGYLELGAHEVCEQVERAIPGASMSENNVHQIWRRFRSELGDQLGLGGS